MGEQAPNPPSAALLDVRGLKVHLETGQRVVRAVDGVDLRVDAGECVGIVGESGSGKSTLVRAITRLLPAVRLAELSGSAHFDGRDLLRMSERELRGVRRSRGFSMIFQDPLGHLNPTQRVGPARSPRPCRRSRRARAGVRASCGCSTRSASPTRRAWPGATRTSSRAACASA